MHKAFLNASNLSYRSCPIALIFCLNDSCNSTTYKFSKAASGAGRSKGTASLSCSGTSTASGMISATGGASPASRLNKSLTEAWGYCSVCPSKMTSSINGGPWLYSILGVAGSSSGFSGSYSSCTGRAPGSWSYFDFLINSSNWICIGFPN